MKYLLAIFMISLQSLCIGQWERLNGHWISDDGKSIYIDNPGSNNNILSSAFPVEKNYELTIFGDTLSFFDQFYTSSTNFEKIQIRRFDLLIINCNDSILIVKPVSDYSKQYLKSEDSIKYTKLKYLVDNTIHLEKIIYHTIEYIGLTPKIDLEIDQDKRIYMNAKFLSTDRWSLDSLISGEFTGTLTDSLYNELVTFVQSSTLRTIKLADVHVDDGAEITMIIYFNGKRRYLKSQMPPKVLYKLIHFLDTIHERIPLTRTNVIREFEK